MGSSTCSHLVTIDLSNDEIRVNSFCINAFHGIENNVTWLNLDDNELTSIPSAIGQLKHLETLNVLHNPLTTIDQSVIISIRRTLSHISIPNMSTWPDAVQYLTKLITLELQGFSRNIPVEAFKGFRSALVELYLHGFNFTTIPSAVCGLQNLHLLIVTTNGHLSGKNLISCNPGLNSLTDLILQNNDRMTTFPYVFNSFPNLNMMIVEGTEISFVDDDLVPNNTKVSIFELNRGNLTIVPGAVNKFPLLNICVLHDNQIHTVEMFSVQNLSHLAYVYLDGNPIVFISRDAFLDVPSLTYIGLTNTQLTTIPPLVETILSLGFLDIRDSPVMCTCEFPRVTSRLTIGGRCHVTNETITDFTRTTLPKCP